MRRLFSSRFRRAVRRAAAAACAVVALAACAARPPAGPYAESRPADQPLLIVIPGLLASRLVDADNDKRVWPPNVAMLMFGWRMRELALPLPARRGGNERTLSATDVVLSRPRRDYYASLLDTLTAAGYDCRSQHDLRPDSNCLLFAWDWRLGFVEAAAALERVVARIRTERGDPDLAVDIIGHSAGALIARYYAQHGGRDLTAALAPRAAPRAQPRVRRMVLMGPPNRGSIFAAYSLMHGYPLGMLTVPPEVLATFDTAYELLPHPDRGWIVDVRGTRVDLDLYDIDTWREFGLSIFDPDVRSRAGERLDSAAEAETYFAALEQRFARGLEHGRRFHTALAAAEPGAPETIEYLILASSCEPTPRYFLAGTAAGRSVLTLEPEAVSGLAPDIDYAALLFAPGDGRVTRASALALGGTQPATGAPAAHTGFVCERHSEMPSNERVQLDMLEFLWSGASRLAAARGTGRIVHNRAEQVERTGQ